MELKKIELPKEMLLKIYEKLPGEIIQERDSGTKKYINNRWVEEKLSYISSNTVIDILNDLFGEFGWNFEIIRFWIESGKDFKKKKKDGEVEVIPQGDIAHVLARITATLYDENGKEYKVIKEAFGSKSITGSQTVQESIFKSAQSDALKKAASLLGIGAELYRKEEESIWFRNVLIGRLFNGNSYVDKLNEILNEYSMDEETLSSFVEAATDGKYETLNKMPSEYLEPLIKLFEKQINESEK